jgi:hypothetical protein
LWVEISLENLVRVSKLSSLGKVMNGLIHSFNGPLQNLGMELEMMRSRLLSGGQVVDDLTKSLVLRLNRMEEELELINQFIKRISMRPGLEGGCHEYMTLREFLEEELWFLKANLYFKHHVRTELELDTNLPLLRNLPKEFPLALSWLMQAIVEEMERVKLRTLRLKATPGESGIRIVLTTKGGKLSKKFLDFLNHDISAHQHLKIADNDLVTILALMTLKSGGVSVAIQVEPSESKIGLALRTTEKV